MRVVVLLSGGLDSATVAAGLLVEGHQVLGLTVDYGQRQHGELAAAARLAAHFGLIEHVVLKADLAVVGGSALTTAQAVPKAA
ncbi:MAG TPA: 7-cyano-7-deazaguanine synthase, partial [Planctomycetota bacterium]